MQRGYNFMNVVYCIIAMIMLWNTWAILTSMVHNIILNKYSINKIGGHLNLKNADQE